MDNSPVYSSESFLSTFRELVDDTQQRVTEPGRFTIDTGSGLRHEEGRW
jgi:hypothetical protein